MIGSEVQAALAHARAQLAALRAGDVDTFLAGEEAYAAACELAARTATSARSLGILVELVAEISSETGRIAAQSELDMARLRRGSHVATAYASAPPRHVA